MQIVMSGSQNLNSFCSQLSSTRFRCGKGFKGPPPAWYPSIAFQLIGKSVKRKWNLGLSECSSSSQVRGCRVASPNWTAHCTWPAKWNSQPWAACHHRHHPQRKWFHPHRSLQGHSSMLQTR